MERTSKPRPATLSDQRRTPTIAATVVTRQTEAQVRHALRGFEVVSSRLIRDFVAIARSIAVAIVVTEPWDMSGAPMAPTIRWFKGEYPSVPVIVFCDHSATAHHEAVPLVRAGIDTLVLRGIDDGPTALRVAAEAALRGCVQRETIEAIKSVVRSDAAAFIEYCIEHASEAVSVSNAAKALGIDRKTLLNRLATQDLPLPREIVAWCRLLLAARLLDDRGRSIEQVGFAIGCGSGSALSNLFVRHCGSRAAEIRERGGVRYVLERFVEVLRRGPIADDSASDLSRTRATKVLGG